MKTQKCKTLRTMEWTGSCMRNTQLCIVSVDVCKHERESEKAARIITITCNGEVYTQAEDGD